MSAFQLFWNYLLANMCNCLVVANQRAAMATIERGLAFHYAFLLCFHVTITAWNVGHVVTRKRNINEGRTDLIFGFWNATVQFRRIFVAFHPFGMAT
jgi:hypothetical protein